MDSIAERRPFSFVNSTGAAIPPFACMGITSAVATSTEIKLSIKKPDADIERLQCRAMLAFNLDRPVADGEESVCSLVMPGQVLVDESFGSPVVGSWLGPQADSWALWVYGHAFVARFSDPTTPHNETSTVKTWWVDDGSNHKTIAYTSGGATGRSGATLGNGSASLRYLDSGFALQAFSPDRVVTYYNLSADSVGLAKYILLSQINGVLVCDWEDCS